MTSALQLETERLLLAAFTPELTAAVREGQDAEGLIGAEIPPGWPDDELRGLLALYANWLRDVPSVVGFGPWIIVERAGNAVVGSAGFVGKPNQEGSIELGFGVHPGHRNRGYASEAARALVRWGLEQPGVDRVVATCDQDNIPSMRVLEKAGLVRLGEEDGQLRWETRRPQ